MSSVLVAADAHTAADMARPAGSDPTCSGHAVTSAMRSDGGVVLVLGNSESAMHAEVGAQVGCDPVGCCAAGG